VGLPFAKFAEEVMIAVEENNILLPAASAAQSQNAAVAELCAPSKLLTLCLSLQFLFSMVVENILPVTLMGSDLEEQSHRARCPVAPTVANGIPTVDAARSPQSSPLRPLV
tara:strand:- start:230 stop:562 length:333 start_codon:yes stop_codon:yes gene_type:complete